MIEGSARFDGNFRIFESPISSSRGFQGSAGSRKPWKFQGMIFCFVIEVAREISFRVTTVIVIVRKNRNVIIAADYY